MNRPLFRLHPLCKLGIACTAVALAFATWEVLPLVAIVGILLLLMVMDVTVSTVKGLAVSVAVCLVLVGCALVFHNSLEESVALALRLEVMIVAALFMVTTPPADLLRGLHSCRVPDSLLLGSLIVFRFLDVVREDLAAIRLASTMVPKGTLRWPVRMYRCVIVPAAYRIFVLSDQLSASVLSRDFGVSKRSQYRPRPVNGVGGVVTVLSVVALGGWHGCYKGGGVDGEAWLSDGGEGSVFQGAGR